MKVSLEFPDAASLTPFDPDYLKVVLIATLYHLGQLSEHEACVALGVTRRAFEDLQACLTRWQKGTLPLPTPMCSTMAWWT